MELKRVIFASKMCKGSEVSRICKISKPYFINENANDLVIAHALFLKLKTMPERRNKNV